MMVRHFKFSLLSMIMVMTMVMIMFLAFSSHAIAKNDHVKTIKETKISYDIAGEAVVKDGDSLLLAGKSVRLYGIDAPEYKQNCNRDGQKFACGREVTLYLKQLVRHQKIRCQRVGTDRYKRMLGICYDENDRDINAHLVSVGLAFAYRQYSWRYYPQEFYARALGAGFWSDGIKIERPWRWRQQNRKN